MAPVTDRDKSENVKEAKMPVHRATRFSEDFAK